MYEKYRKHFLKTFEKSSKKYASFPQHVDIVVKWAEKLCKRHPETDRDVVMIGAWFHDIGHFVNNENDHSVSSEKEALKFLTKENFSNEKIKQILHVVRSHRNNDVKPQTIEAEIVCCAK